MQSVGFVGGGKMAEALASGMLAKALVSPDHIIVCEPLAARRDYLESKLGVRTSPDNPAAAQADVVVLAVKPNVVPSALRSIRDHIGPSHLVVSIAAGVTLATIEAGSPRGARVGRGLRAQVTRSSIVLSTGEPSAPAPLPDVVVTLAVPGTAHFGPWRFQAQLTRRPAGDLAKAKAGDANVALLDAGACGPSLELRRRRRGDRFHPLGMPGSKKLQDFFVDAHVPRSERDAVPLVCGDQGIAWVVTQRPAEWAKVTAKTKRVLRIHATLSPP